MAERSQYWDTAGAVGDGADTYSAVQVREQFRALFSTDRYASEGVLAGVLNSLAVSGATSPLSVASGGALVNGILLPEHGGGQRRRGFTPAVGTTKRRVVLQAIWGQRADGRIAPHLERGRRQQLPEPDAKRQQPVGDPARRGDHRYRWRHHAGGPARLLPHRDRAGPPPARRLQRQLGQQRLDQLPGRRRARPGRDGQPGLVQQRPERRDDHHVPQVYSQTPQVKSLAILRRTRPRGSACSPSRV